MARLKVQTASAADVYGQAPHSVSRRAIANLRDSLMSTGSVIAGVVSVLTCGGIIVLAATVIALQIH